MKGPHERDLPLEGIRGLCAMLVVFGHMTYQAPLLDPGYACDLLHVDYGPQAVFVFFVLSGYVIGLTTRTPATGAAIRNYCTRRLLRIVPIAWISILLTWLFLGHNSTGAFVGNLLFLQNARPYPFGLRVPVLYDNPPLWSLSYEMLYYALFVAVWKYRPRMRTLLTAVVLISFSDSVGMPSVFAHHAAYFLFWLTGLCIAWHTDEPAAGSTSAWPTCIAAAFAIWSLLPIHAFLGALSQRLARFDDDRFHLDVLLGSALVVLATTRRAPVLQRRLADAAIVVGLCAFPLKFLEGSLSYIDLIGAAVLLACVLARKWRPSLRPLASLAPVGVVSYALYVTAYPLMRLVYRCPFLPSGSLGTFLFRAGVLSVLCAAVAFVLERVLQPRIVRGLGAWLRLRPVGTPHAAPASAGRP